MPSYCFYSSQDNEPCNSMPKLEFRSFHFETSFSLEIVSCSDRWCQLLQNIVRRCSAALMSVLLMLAVSIPAYAWGEDYTSRSPFSLGLLGEMIL